VIYFCIIIDLGFGKRRRRRWQEADVPVPVPPACNVSEVSIRKEAPITTVSALQLDVIEVMTSAIAAGENVSEGACILACPCRGPHGYDICLLGKGHL
jgi:hypothetical protein